MPSYNSIALHPDSHKLSESPQLSYDVICIGSGWAGRTLAAKVVQQGLTAVIIEKELVGGDCPFWACVPSKALLRPQQTFDEARSVTGIKELLPEVSDLARDTFASRVFERRDAFTARWDDQVTLVPMVESSGVKLIRGIARLSGVKTVVVRDTDDQEAELTAKHAVALCTGSEPVVPMIPGLEEINYWTPRQATSSSEVPSCMVVLGAGAVGCELALAYSSLGSRVTLLNGSAEILSRLDPEAGKLVREGLVKKGVEVRVNAKVKTVSKAKSGAIRVELIDGGTIRCSHILVATGRRPITSGLGLERFGIQGDNSPIKVDESLRVTDVEGTWLYAAGDINTRSPFTHMCKYQGTIAANAIVERARNDVLDPADWSRMTATADRVAIPQVLFTSPEVASVGLTRRAAKAAGIVVREITAPVWSLGAAIWKEGYDQGWAQWIVDEATGKLVGATIVGDGAAELLHASTMAIVGGMTLDRIMHAVPCFPTMSEVYLNLIQAAGY